MLSKILVFLIALSIQAVTANAQVETVFRTGFKTKKKNNDYEFIHAKTDTSTLKFIGTFKATSRNRAHEIGILSSMVFMKVIRYGGNAFRYKEYILEPDKRSHSLIVDVYYASDSMLKINAQNYERNILYIFGDTRVNGKTQILKLNGRDISLPPRSYYFDHVSDGDKIEVMRGDARMLLRFTKDNPPMYLEASGFGIGNGSYTPGFNLSFHNGSIDTLKFGCGPLLASILTNRVE